MNILCLLDDSGCQKNAIHALEYAKSEPLT